MNEFQAFDEVMEDYFDKGHAESVPDDDKQKPPREVFYLLMHAIRKESSTATKLRAVFDASVKSSTGVSLNDTLLMGPTVHSPLVDVLLRFQLHRITLVADVSQMYRAVELIDSNSDLHRFVWRSSPEGDLPLMMPSACNSNFSLLLRGEDFCWVRGTLVTLSCSTRSQWNSEMRDLLTVFLMPTTLTRLCVWSGTSHLTVSILQLLSGRQWMASRREWLS